MSKPMTKDQVLILLRERTREGQAAWAISHDISPQYVSDVLNNRRGPGASILKALGLRQTTLYSRAE